MGDIPQLHAFIVHFPIALFVFYTVIEIWEAFSKNQSFGITQLVLLGFIAAAAVLAALTGNQAEQIASQAAETISNYPKELVELHESFATYTIWYFILLFGLRFYFVVKKKFEGKIKYAFAALALAGCVLVLTTGKLGGDLVYKYGIGTSLFN